MSMQFSDASDRETAEAYEEGLAQLTDNARHVIMHLTELAHDYARDKKERIIVAVIERHIRKVKPSHKLPALYLMDSIVKNHQVPYKDLFQQNIVSTFASVFFSAPEKVRSLMYKLRNTWNDIFTATKLFQLDNKVKSMDPAWPIVSLPTSSTSSSTSSSSSSSGNIHVNPAVFNRPRDENAPIFEELQRKERELLELRKKKIELELEVARKEVLERQSKVEREPSKPSQQRSSKKTGDERGTSSQRRDPRIRDKASETSNKRCDVFDNGSHENKASDSSSTPSSPSNRYDKDQKSSHKSSKSSFSPSKSKSSSSHDRSRKSKESPSSSSSRIKKSSSSTKKSSSSSSLSKSSSSSSKGSPPSSPKKRGRDPSSSPSPPPSEVPELGDEAPVVTSAKDQQSRVKDLGRIPKKINKKSDDSTLLHGLSEEETQTDFGLGGKFSKSLNNKRRGTSLKDESSPPEKKKKELSMDLFGTDGITSVEELKPSDTIIVDPMPSPSTTGWAKFKETNPDEFHTPIRNNRRHGPNDRFNIGNDFRGGRGGGFGHRRSRIDRRHCANNAGVPGGDNSFGPFDHVGGPSGTATPIFNNNMIEMVLQNMQNPEHVRNEVIPTIVKQAQENLQSGRMNNTQFSELMRQVMTLKEQAMMIQAERRSNDPPPFASHKPPQNSGPNPPNFNQQQQTSSIPFFNQQIFNGDQPQQQSRPPFRPHVRDLPQASQEDLDMIKNDPVKTIPIDGESREIRQYDEVCTVVMGDCDIKELSFQPGTRRVIIDDNIIVPCELDVKHYTSVLIDGVEHNIKIGAPTRELWVDGQWYECYFDNKVQIRLGMTFHTFFLEGPAPTVKIGERRPDLCPGRVNLIIDADFSRMTPIFLDAKPQQFDIDGKPHVIRFVEGLKTVLINGHPYRTEFGGMPMVIFVDGIKHFVRLTVLPRGVTPGLVKIRNMPMGLGISNVPSARCEDEIRPPTPRSINQASPQPMDQDMEVPNNKVVVEESPLLSESENSNGASLENMDEVGSSSAFDKLLPLFPKSASADKENKIDTYKSEMQIKEAKETPETPEAPKKDNPVDVHNLWKQLLGAGLVSSGSNGICDGSNGKKTIPGLDTSISHEEEVNKENLNPEEEAPSVPASKHGEPDAPPEVKTPNIKPITLKSHHNSLKERQQSIVNLLYDPSALQCKNCGLRYSPVDMISYSQHLDWHFRMKRREKDNAKKAQSRRWYFERMDWIVSDEIEEEEKENTNTEPNETEKEIPTVPASQLKEENTCPICKEEFEQFYKDDTDEDGKWLLYNAIKRDDGTFHPQCYQDFTEDKNLNSSLLSQDESMNQSNPENMDIKTQEEEEERKPPIEDVQIKVEKMDEEEQVLDESYQIKKEEEEESIEMKSEVLNEAVEDVKQELSSSSPQEADGEEDSAVVKSEKEDVPSEEEETLDGMEDNSLPILSAPKTIRVNLTTPLPGSGASSPKVPETDDSLSNAPQSEEEGAGMTNAKVGDEGQACVSQEEELRNEDETAEYDPAAIIQNFDRPSDTEESKPGLKGKKLIIIPPQKKDGELSGLCAIM